MLCQPWWLGHLWKLTLGHGENPAYLKKCCESLRFSLPLLSRTPFCSHCYSSVTQCCPRLCDPMDCSTPGFPVVHRLPELAQIRVHFHPTILSSVVLFSSCLQSFPASRSFLLSRFFASGGQSIGASASASVLPMNIQDWFPLGLTGLNSLQSKILSKVFSNTTV